MALRSLLKNPNKFLRQPAVDVVPGEIGTSEMNELIEDMIETMYDANGIGLAGPQIGVGKRIIVVHSDDAPHIFLNPRLVKTSLRKVESEEGCLSVPGTFGVVKRFRSVTVQALNRHGDPVTIKAEGLTAIVFQHEIDHLHGTLFIDKVERFTEASSAL